MSKLGKSGWLKLKASYSYMKSNENEYAWSKLKTSKWNQIIGAKHMLFMNETKKICIPNI